MPATTVSLTRLDGFPAFHCFHCGAVIFSEDGPAESLCRHVSVLWDSYGEPELGPAAGDGIAEKLDEVEEFGLEELSGVLGDSIVVFELIEPARGGGHDGYVFLVAIIVDGFDVDET